jgi:HlyD family secretion protein
LNLSHSIRTLIRKVPAGLLVALSLGAFWLLSNGMTTGPGSIVGYAEEREHAIGPIHSGQLLEVLVQLGQDVRKGDVLARFDTQLLELERERLKAELEQAKDEIAAERDRETAQLQRGQILAVRQFVAEERNRAELRELDLRVKRLTQLRAENLIRAEELEEARRRQQALIADLAARPAGTTRELQSFGMRPNSTSTQANRLTDRLAPLHSALKVKEAALRQLEFTINAMTLRAPVSGRVGAILLQPGTVVPMGAPVLSLTTMREGHVVAFVPERQIRNIAVGTALTLRRLGITMKTLRGHVVELAPQVEEVPVRARPAPTVPVWSRRIVIKLDEAAVLLPGEAFRVSAR